MEKETGQLSRVPLRVLTPPTDKREVDVDFGADAILTLEQRLARDIALNSLSAQRRRLPPNDEVVN